MFLARRGRPSTGSGFRRGRRIWYDEIQIYHDCEGVSFGELLSWERRAFAAAGRPEPIPLVVCSLPCLLRIVHYCRPCLRLIGCFVAFEVLGRSASTQGRRGVKAQRNGGGEIGAEGERETGSGAAIQGIRTRIAGKYRIVGYWITPHGTTLDWRVCFRVCCGAEEAGMPVAAPET